MPGMDGWAVLQALKADSELQNIPVVMISISGEKELGYTLGAVELSVKTCGSRETAAGGRTVR